MTMMDAIEGPADAPAHGRWPVVTTDAANLFHWTAAQVQAAMQRASANVRPGRRYEVRVTLVEIDETPGFVGEGI